jgi:putative transposase
MPWNETCAMDERMRFIVAASQEGSMMSEVCDRFGISRQTGYKWLARYAEAGVDGLKERSRAPIAHGRSRPAGLVSAVLTLRERYPHWGPKKLRVKLGGLMPDVAVPAASTIGDWLCKERLTEPRKRRRHCTPSPGPLTSADAPNKVWSIDFKGWFRTGEGKRCDPLTLTDAMSRYILRCQAVERLDHAHVREVLEAAFCEFGLPLVIRSDNGTPFASTGAGGLSALSLWWIKLGIAPERIALGKPQQNGRHERMHRTLKAETASPPAPTLAEQQHRFDRFRETFNADRPHEALEFLVPAKFYRPSPRSYPCALREPEYVEGMAVRRVRSNGEIKWGGELIFISEVLIGESVGISETESGEWLVFYANIELGFIDKSGGRLCRRKRPAHVPPACGLVDSAVALPTIPQEQQQKQAFGT